MLYYHTVLLYFPCVLAAKKRTDTINTKVFVYFSLLSQHECFFFSDFFNLIIFFVFVFRTRENLFAPPPPPPTTFPPLTA